MFLCQGFAFIGPLLQRADSPEILMLPQATVYKVKFSLTLTGKTFSHLQGELVEWIWERLLDTQTQEILTLKREKNEQNKKGSTSGKKCGKFYSQSKRAVGGRPEAENDWKKVKGLVKEHIIYEGPADMDNGVGLTGSEEMALWKGAKGEKLGQL